MGEEKRARLSENNVGLTSATRGVANKELLRTRKNGRWGPLRDLTRPQGAVADQDSSDGGNTTARLKAATMVFPLNDELPSREIVSGRRG
jgi:hypothetical protein